MLDNAFVDFDIPNNGEPLNFDTILQQPNMEDVDYVELKWKPSILEEEKDIFSLSYNRFWEMWNLVLMVAGMREAIRPYSMRVGAGGRFHGESNPCRAKYSGSNYVKGCLALRSATMFYPTRRTCSKKATSLDWCEMTL